VGRVTRCKDTGLPSTSSQYYVKAVDRDNTGNLREGDASATVTVPATSDNNPPNPVTGLQAAPLGSSTILSWQAPATPDPDPGDSIRFYRIYRDGTDWVNNFYAETSGPAATTFTDTQTGGSGHTYYVVSVDQSFMESTPASVFK
jgi:hypothetical protein